MKYLFINKFMDPAVKEPAGISKEQYDSLVEQFGKDAADKITAKGKAIEDALNAKYEDVAKGLLGKKEFDEFKGKEIKELNDQILKLEKAATEQGTKINELLSGMSGGAKIKSIEDFFTELMPKIVELRAKGAGIIEIKGEDLRKAGVFNFRGGSKAAATTSLGAGTVGGTDGSILAGAGSALASPYLPGLGGSDLEMFDIVRNPNFILNHVDVGRTNQARLAWINEVDYQGTPGTTVAESGQKPLVQHKFQVEYSIAKKAAARIALTEEFEEDVPGLATAVRRMLQADVIRAFDDAIQLLVIAAAHPYEITGLDAKIAFSTVWDAIGALLAQVGYYNFVPNTVGLNTVTNWQMNMEKDDVGRYNVPPFVNRINALLVEANKIAVGYGLAGDLSQYKVDIYKDFTLRVGWINEQFINNEFSIVGELRYHAYISDNRKKAIVYNQLAAVQSNITAGS